MEESHELALSHTKKFVEKLASSIEENEDPTLMRFLIAKSMDPEKAAKLFVEWKKLRSTLAPLGYVPESEISDQLEAKETYLQLFSKKGFPILLTKMCKHFPSKDQNKNKKLVVYMLDKATAASSINGSEQGNGKFITISDMKDISFRSVDVGAMTASFQILQVAVSLGGDSVQGQSAYFQPSSIDSWVSNAVSSLTNIVQQYNLDGIDIDYEHFNTDPETFAQCIGQLISTLKKRGVISFASIAPFDDDVVQSHYQALWKNYGHLIDYVNFQFYAYDASTTVSQFINYFDTQMSNYNGGKILVSFATDGSGGLSPENGFFKACNRLKNKGKLHGIFVWDADDSKAAGFPYEKQSQALLAT